MSQSIATIIHMLENLPTAMQDNIVQHVKSYLEDLERDQKWESTFLNLRDTLATFESNILRLE